MAQITNNIKLGRFDLCYTEDNFIEEPNLKEEITDWLSSSWKKVKSKDRNSQLEYRRLKGSILRIGHRKSANYFRIYEKNQTIRFELERKYIHANWQKAFFGNNFLKFETQLFKAYNRCLKNT